MMASVQVPKDIDTGGVEDNYADEKDWNNVAIITTWLQKRTLLQISTL